MEAAIVELTEYEHSWVEFVGGCSPARVAAGRGGEAESRGSFLRQYLTLSTVSAILSSACPRQARPMAKSSKQWRGTLGELAEQSGASARTIRFYIARGLLPPPEGAGRAAAYGPRHLERLKKIRALQAQGLTLAEIAWHLSEGQLEPKPVEPSAWWCYRVAEDVIVWVRSATRPWRLNRLRASINRMAAELNSAKKGNNDRHAFRH